MITRIVKAKLKADKVAEFKQFMDTFTAETRQIDNLHHIDYFADNDEPLHFHMYTIWKTPAAMNRFLKSDLNITFKHNLTQWCSAPYSAWTVENI